jgi:hypothetical protein
MTKEKGQKDKEKLEDTKEVIKSRKLEKDRQYNDKRLLITFLVPSSFSLSFCLFSFVIVLFFVFLFTASDYLFGIFKPLFVLLPFFFCHCIVCPSSIYGF